MTVARVLLFGSMVWAAAFILSAWVFRGSVVNLWIQGVLYVVWTMWFSYWSIKGKCVRT